MLCMARRYTALAQTSALCSVATSVTRLLSTVSASPLSAVSSSSPAGRGKQNDLVDTVLPRLAAVGSNTHHSVVQQVGNKLVQLQVAGSAGPLQLQVTTRPHDPHHGAAAALGSAADASRLNKLTWAVRGGLAATFLPAGYPASVGPGYLPFVWWQALHHGASSANGVLASTFLLYAVGLGAGAVPTAGAINWVLKDGLGQLGTLLFAKTIAHNFDLHTKTWYLAASGMLNVAIGLEITTFLFPQHFLAVGSVANMMKGLAWMAGGSTRSAFNVSFQRGSNIADITAKATSQTICTSLIGTAAGVSLASAIGQRPALGLGAFAALASVHLYSAYRCVKCIPLTSLNPTRLELLVDAFLAAQSPGAGEQAALPTPQQLALEDPPLALPRLLRDARFLPRIRTGTPLARLVAGDAGSLAALLRVYKGQRHIAVVAGGEVHLILHSAAAPRDCLLASLQAGLLRIHLRQGARDPRQDGQELHLADTLAEASAIACCFNSALQAAGWDVGKVVLEAQRQRAWW